MGGGASRLLRVLWKIRVSYKPCLRINFSLYTGFCWWAKIRLFFKKQQGVKLPLLTPFLRTAKYHSIPMTKISFFFWIKQHYNEKISTKILCTCLASVCVMQKNGAWICIFLNKILFLHFDITQFSKNICIPKFYFNRFMLILLESYVRYFPLLNGIVCYLPLEGGHTVQAPFSE